MSASFLFERHFDFFSRVTKSVSKKRAAPKDDSDSEMFVYFCPLDCC